jgi:DNA-binding NarL/FixJ family response regulator
MESPIERLSHRQAEILRLIGKGFRNREIALQLGLSERVVKACVSQLLLLFDATNRTELAGTLALESPTFEHPPRGRGSADRAADGKPPPVRGR